MKLVKKILHKLNGLYFPQDYLCLAKENFPSPLQVYLVSGNRVIENLTSYHVFAGYCPLIFAFHSFKTLAKNIDLAFCHNSLQPNDIFPKKDAIARLSMKKINEQIPGGKTIAYYEGIKGSHHFVSGFHQSIIALHNRLYNNKPGNVFLKDNLYIQVQIAYAIPRNISLITVGQNALYNLFPTDLHGPVGDDHYLISLRQYGKACQQVETLKKITISQMNAAAYKMVYVLGKNHMQKLHSKEYLPFSTLSSDIFHLPIPEQALAYKELELETSFIHGIHKLLLFKIIHKKQLTDTPATLAHIHNGYATWRHNNHLAGNYLLR